MSHHHLSLYTKFITVLKGPFIYKVTGGPGEFMGGHLKNFSLLGGSKVKNWMLMGGGKVKR